MSELELTRAQQKIERKLKQANESADINELQLVLSDYRNLVNKIITKLELVNTTEEVPVPTFFEKK